MMSKKEPLKIATSKENKKIFFDENGEIIDKPEQKEQKQKDKTKKSTHKVSNGKDIGTKWFQLYDEYNTKELSEIKESEFRTFEEHCRKCFNEELENLEKNNPSDAKWLQTALHKGTTKDRANAGALLVQSNPLPNLSALDSLVTLTKFSNKNSSDILETVTNLFKNLLPSHRKLIPLDQRGNDWKNLKKMTIDMETRNQIYAHWYYENELKGRFNAYLQSLQGSLQNGKEINKIKAIISASNLLKSCPEREAYILNIIVNKFGDPDKKIASKATYNLRQILLTHPNMAHVMILETEKLIFRKNINDLAQHYGIGFLSLIAPIANVQSSQKLIDICFSFFKIKIEKGDINSKTMQSILNCIRIAIQNINDFNEEKKKIEIATPDVVNTIYRLIYLSNISIAFQALSLLLQLVLVQNENHDRFYNALYRKMLDPEIYSANNKITSLYFHIIHRAVHQDSNVSRCKAFIKRLLQMSLSFSSSKACGALIVISKLLKSRPELKTFYLQEVTVKSEIKTDKIASNKKIEDMSDDEDEQYKDVEIDGKVIEHEKSEEPVKSSWIHVKNTTKQKEETSSHIKAPTKYDPFKRSAAYSGAEFTLFYELILMSKYFHPTVQVFVENILKNQKINYYGDPLKDFSISHFLERFAFKNPKKSDPKEEKSAFHNNYQPKGSRGLSVHSLTEQSCTEDERFIFDFIQRKREIRENNIKMSENDEDVDDLESVDDDEFDSYLDTLGAKADFDKSEKDFDYLSEIRNESAKKEAVKGKKKAQQDDDEESLNDDNWEDDFDGSEGSEMNESDFGDESGTDQSIDEDMDSMDDLSDSNDDEMNDTAPKSTKKASKKQSKREEKGIDNLFVAVDDFSEMIEKNSSKHGTLGEIFNKDKSSQKQLDWEDKRHNRPSGFKRKNSSGKGKFPFKKKFKK